MHSVVVTEEEFKCFCNFFLEKCDEQHQDILYTTYTALSQELKARLSDILNERLSKSFDFKVYYRASIYDIVDYRSYLHQYLATFTVPIKRQPHPFEHLSGEISYREINNLMNLIFKNKDKLSLDFIRNLKGISDYYDWLLNMEAFNYNKFNPLWIIQYPTRYFLEKIFSINKIRTKVRFYLKNHHQPTLAGYYAQYVK